MQNNDDCILTLLAYITQALPGGKLCLLVTFPETHIDRTIITELPAP